MCSQQVAVLLVCLAGLTFGMPSRFPSASSVNTEELKQTIGLVGQIIPAMFDAINDEKADPNTRLNKLVDTSLVMSESALKLSKPTAANERALEEVQAARNTLPLILNLLKATMTTFADETGNFDYDGDDFDFQRRAT